jgi:N-acetylneuraminic acid mutarotase
MIHINVGSVEGVVVSQNGDGPGLREGPCMVYEPLNNLTVLFGGDENTDDTWFYDTATNVWSEHTGFSPPGRINAAMVYCSDSNEMIMYGGLGDTRTWSFNCETQSWSQVTTGSNPGIHQSHTMAYDSVENVVILFGGITSSAMTAINDTWIFDCDTREWTELHPSDAPIARYGHVMTYDASINRTIMAFGLNYSVGFLNDMWTYDVSTNVWSQIDYIGTPNHLKWSSIVYDSTHEKNILFGGCIMYPSYEAVDDTCEFDGETYTWTDLESTLAPTPRLMPGLSFDSKHSIVILHGGINAGGDSKFGDTWTYSYESNTWFDTSLSSYTPPTTISGTDTDTTNPLLNLMIPVVIVGVVAAAVFVVLVILRKRK